MNMTAPARHRSRRRIAALNFLSNISLDGTHRDTKYSIFLKRGLEHIYSSEKSCKRSPTEFDTTVVDSVDLDVPTDCINSAEHLLTSTSNRENLYDLNDPVETTSTRDEYNKNSSKRCRASSFSDAKVQALKHRRSLFHTYSISEDATVIEVTNTGNVPISKSSMHAVRIRNVSSSSSQDSVASCSKSLYNFNKINKKNVRFASNGEKLQFRDRVVLLTGSKHPFAVFSTLPYYKQNKHGSENNRKRHERFSLVPGANELLYGYSHGTEDSQAISYGHLLVPTKNIPAVKKTASLENHLYPIAENNSAQSSAAVEGENAAEQPYDPCLLDDPELQSGKHRTVLTFPSYVTSVIDYAKPSDLKKELNEKFKEMFPHIQLTLTKLRSLKRDIRKIATKCGIDLWTVAQSYVFFEKIILKGLINKVNRRLVATASLILSAKLNDVKGIELTKLISELEEYFKLNRKDVQRCEFGVLVALEFSLLVPDKEVMHHYQRLKEL